MATSSLWRQSTVRVLAAAGVLGLLAVSNAEAGWISTTSGGQYTYTYTSPKYVDVNNGANVGGTYATSQWMTWSFTLGAPLESNLNKGLDLSSFFTFIDVAPPAWTYNDGHPGSAGGFDQSQGASYITVFTDEAGAITTWAAAFAGPYGDPTALGISFGGELFPEEGVAYQLARNLLDGTFPEYEGGILESDDEQLLLITFLALQYGDFSASPDADRARYVYSAVPEPASLALVGLGFGLMGSVWRRKIR